jgi:hypothetical protein
LALLDFSGQLSYLLRRKSDTKGLRATIGSITISLNPNPRNAYDLSATGVMGGPRWFGCLIVKQYAQEPFDFYTCLDT